MATTKSTIKFLITD